MAKQIVTLLLQVEYDDESSWNDPEDWNFGADPVMYPFRNSETRLLYDGLEAGKITVIMSQREEAKEQ